MVIYKHNLAEKLFGFAYSKEFLRQNTDLCGFVDDPNVALDIDLAIDFHRALRSDPIAAEKFTNVLILSSSYIDASTAEFYTDKMKQYPVFDDHIDRINDIFDSIANNTPILDPTNIPDDVRERKEIGDYINRQLKDIARATTTAVAPVTAAIPGGVTPFATPERVLYEQVSLTTGYTVQQLEDISFNSNFNNALKNALSDCLNSPCNLFAETSDSIASLANVSSMMNSNTIPTWGELKNNFFNALGGVSDTVFKKVPMSIKNSIIELGQIGQKAVEQSTEMFFAKDPETKQKIIAKARSGQSLNTDSKGYKYLPDLDSYLNASKMSSNILAKAAEDLGGCFNKFQQAYRYEPYNPDHNKSITSTNPITNKWGDSSYSHNTLGKTNNDYDRRTDGSMSSCDYAEPEPISGSPLTTAGRGKISELELRRNIRRALSGSSLIGYVPKDGGRYGITNGTAEEWEDFFVRLAKYESGFNTGTRNDADPGGSLGLFQISIYDGSRYGANPTGANWTEAEAFDPYNNTLTAIRIFEKNVPKTGYISTGSGKGAGGYYAATTMTRVRSDVSSNTSPYGGGSAYRATSNEGTLNASNSNKEYWYGDSIAVGYGGDADGTRKVGASPSTILGWINQDLASDPNKFKGATVYLSTGVSNNPSDMASIERQIDTLTKAGANVRVVGGANGTYDAQNAQIGRITTQYSGATYLGGFTPGNDGVHPKSYNTLPSQSVTRSAAPATYGGVGSTSQNVQSIDRFLETAPDPLDWIREK